MLTNVISWYVIMHCYAEREDVTVRGRFLHRSFRPSVTFMYAFHAFWNTWTVTVILSTTSAMCFNGSTPENGVEWRWDEECRKKQYSMGRWGQSYLEGLIGNRIRAFDWCKNK